MVPIGTDQAESHTARKFRRRSVCLAPVDVQVMLFSISSISILSSVVAISVTSKRRPPRPRSPPRSPPLAPADTQHNTASRSGRQTDSLNAQQPDRTACCAPRGRDGGGRASSTRAGGMGEAGSALEMRRLEAPVRDKPGIDQHQRRALHQDVREIGSVIKKCSTAGRLRVTKRRLNRSGR